MNTYAFLTRDSFRVEVKASTAKAGYNKLMDIPHLAKKVTDAYIKYNKNGLASFNWRKV